MITVTVRQGPGNLSIDVTGHADYAKKGQDIVCSAVSAIIQTAILGLRAVAKQYPEHVRVTSAK